VPAPQTVHPLPLPLALSLPLAPADDVLLDWAEPLDGARVLVVGHGALDLICGLIRRGCTAATEIQPHGRLAPGADSADLVIAPRVESPTQARAAIDWAARALVMGGRFAARDATGHLRQELAALLSAQGFCRVRTYIHPEGVVVTAERPIFGPLHRS
jgi:hypothetical protein